VLASPRGGSPELIPAANAWRYPPERSSPSDDAPDAAPAGNGVSSGSAVGCCHAVCRYSEPHGSTQLAEGGCIRRTQCSRSNDAVGNYTYTYTADGELETKTNTTNGEQTLYAYDVLGNLLSVSLPNGTLVEYLVDGQGRRVGKMVNGTCVKQWLYSDQLSVVAELTGGGTLVSQFVYGSRPNVPDLMLRGGVQYRIISDQLGSFRAIINASTGAIEERMRHDAWGNVLEDTNSGFVPFGFAGGLYDADTGLVRFGARDYDPVAGRWMSKDPTRWSKPVSLLRKRPHQLPGLDWPDADGSARSRRSRRSKQHGRGWI
jgi:RHS repeat-associated protein